MYHAQGANCVFTAVHQLIRLAFIARCVHTLSILPEYYPNCHNYSPFSRDSRNRKRLSLYGTRREIFEEETIKHDTSLRAGLRAGRVDEIIGELTIQIDGNERAYKSRRRRVKLQFIHRSALIPRDPHSLPLPLPLIDALTRRSGTT